jgi:hypothetical protein
MIMGRRTRGLGLAVGLLGLLLAGCGKDPAPEDQAAEARSAGEVASTLVVAADLGGDWSVTQMPDFPELSETGVVSDEVRPMLPQMGFCDRAGAEAQAAADDLEWVAFRQLDLATGEPTEPPSPGRPPVHHIVFAQEFLATGEPDQLATTYDALVAGGDACLGTETTPDDETVHTTVLGVPGLGDASHGWRDVIREPGPTGRGATWNLRRVLVLDGDVLLMAQVAEIATPGVPTVLDDARVGVILESMVDKLH